MIDSITAMRAAIAEAWRAQGPCHPNPGVGAVVVHGGEIVARGHTQAPGSAHAEVEALRDFADSGLRPDAETTLYVTLEPCCTYGRTPPCTEAIIASGIRRVVVGATDPNPQHAGRGFPILEEAGIEVISDVLAEDCAAPNLVFNHWMQTGRPLIAGKCATTLDGKIATRTGHSQWITGPEARQDVARWRRAFPAIAVGGGTVVADDPSLTARVEGEPVWCPWRLIFDRSGKAMARPQVQVFSDSFAERTIYLTDPARIDSVPTVWRDRGVAVWALEDWATLESRLLENNLTGVYVEGGPGLLSDLLRAQRLDYLFAYQAPKWLGDGAAPGVFSGFEPATMDGAFQLAEVQHATFGDDRLMRGWIRYPESG